MTTAKRSNLLEVSANTLLHHPGLALSRYLPETDDKHVSANALFKSAENSPASEAYKTAFERWKTAMEKDSGIVLFSMELEGPMAVGLGNESPMEIGLTTHHTYGMPTIPGSALKGMCARVANKQVKTSQLTQEQYDAMFGNTKSASYLTFWDAWYDAGSAGSKPFHRDVITVHHQDYYSGKGKKDGKDCWPTDFDDPVPIPFLVVRPGSKFWFALSIPEEWRGTGDNPKHGEDFVSKLLQYALCNLGVGGKTNAGYGFFKKPEWLRIEDEEVAKRAKEIAGAEAAAELKRQRVADEVANSVRWENATVIWSSGNKELSASHGTQKAKVQKDEVEALVQNLSASLRDKLFNQKKKTIQADVYVSPVGNAWKIVRIVSKEQGV